MRGDSFVIVNREGRRTFNEKEHYDGRVRHFWSDVRSNLQFYICDKRNIDMYRTPCAVGENAST